MLLGCYFSFNTNEYVYPELKSDSSSQYTKNDQSNSTTTSKDVLKAQADIVKRHSIVKFNRTNSEFNDEFLQRSNIRSRMTHHTSISSEDLIEDYIDSNYNMADTNSNNNSLLEADEFSSLDMYLNNEEALNSLDELNNDENESETNSKVDSYVDEIIELIVRDFVMSWMSSLIWDKDKLTSLAK